MSNVVVHGIPASPYTWSAELGLAEKGVAFTSASLAMGGATQPEHLARQPFGRIPVLDHDGFVLYETQAILRYVDRAFPGPALQPTDLKALARMDQAINIVDWYAFPSIGVGTVAERLYSQMFWQRGPDEAAIERARPLARTSLRVLDGLLGDGPFLGGKAPSLADVHATPFLWYLTTVPDVVLFDEHPRLRAWVDRMAARPTFQATQAPQLRERTGG